MDYDDYNVAGPSRVQAMDDWDSNSNMNSSPSLLQTPPTISYPNLGRTDSKVKAKEQSAAVDCYQ
jgi:hypothetical protein